MRKFVEAMGRGVAAMSALGLFMTVSAVGWPPQSLAQSHINVYGMPKDMQLKTVPLDNGTVRQPDPVQQPAPATMDVQSGQITQGATNTPPALTPQQLEYLRKNTATIQPPNNSPAPSAPSSNSAPSPVFIGSTYTGFLPPQNQVPNNLPTTRTVSPSSGIVKIGGQAINSTPTRILLDSAKAAGSALAPQTPAFSLLKGASMTSDVLRAQQSGGSFAANEKVFEKTFVLGAQTAGSVFGPVGAASAAGVAQLSYDTGKAIQPWLDSKIKLSDSILAIDQKFGISRDARALANSQKEIQKLQQRVNAANLQKLHTRRTLAAPSFQTPTPVPAPTTRSAVAPTTTPYRTRIAPAATTVVAPPTRTAAPSSPYMTTSEAYAKGISPQKLRPLTSIESIDAIARGANPQGVNNLRTLKRPTPVVASTPAPVVNRIPAKRPYLGAGQHAIDNAFSPSKANRDLSNRAASHAATTSPSHLNPRVGNTAMPPSHSNNPASAPVYTFKRTPYGTIETFKNGQRIATTTPDYAAQRYGYNPSASKAHKMNLTGFGVTKEDVRSVTKTPTTAMAAPSNTDFADAPGKPKNAIAPRPAKRSHRTIQYERTPRHYYRTPRYRQYQPRGPDCQQLHAMAVQRMMMGDLSACYQLRAVCPAYVASCG